MTQTTDSFEFSLDLKASPAPVAESSTDRLMAPPFRAHPINSEAALVHVEGHYPPRRLNLQLVQILSLCDALRSPDQHIRYILSKLGLATQHGPAIKEALDHLAGQSLLLDEASLLAMMATQKSPLPKPPQLAHLFIRTAERPSALQRLLSDLSSKATLPGLSVWVLDDSSSSDTQKANCEAAEALRERWPGQVHYINREQRKMQITHIANGANVDRARLAWLIEGDEADPTPSYGASLNLALLLAAGQRFCIMDDDATLDAQALEDARFDVSLRSKRQQRTAGLDPNLAESSQFPKANVHPLAQHAQWLGLSLQEIAGDVAPHHMHFLSHMTPQLLHQVTGQPSIRLTTNGTLGDPGTSGMNWLFSQPPKDWHAFCHQDPSWAERIFNRRFARASLGTQITTDFSLMTTTLTGIDNRELLLPTVAKGRNEDLLFAVLMHFLYPDALSADLPFMLPHRPDEPRRWTDEDLDRRAPIHEKYNHMMILADLIESLDLPAGEHRSRLAYLMAWLSNFARLDQVKAKDLVMNYITELQAEQVRAINETASQLDAPNWLKALFARAINQILDEDAQFDEHISKLTTPIQRFAGQYAQSMDDWVGAWLWCCQHDMSQEQP